MHPTANSGLLIENLCGSGVVCAAGDAGRSVLLIAEHHKQTNLSAMWFSMNKHFDSIVILTLLLCWSCVSGQNVAAQNIDRTNNPYASDKPLSEPAIFAEGIVSTGDFDSHPAFTTDGKTLYFLRSTPNFNLWTILVSRFEKGRWGTPEVAPFSGQYSDADPFITSDGSRFYFISNRPVAGKSKPDLDIWVMEKTAAGWSEPKNVGAPINSSGSEWYPTVAVNGTIYFGSDREGGKVARTSTVRVSSMASTPKRKIWAMLSIHNLMNLSRSLLRMKVS